MTNRNKALLFITVCTSVVFLAMIIAPGSLVITMATFVLCSLLDVVEKRPVLYLMNGIVAGLVLNACLVFAGVKLWVL